MKTSEWQPIETAPKGEPSAYGNGPKVLGVRFGSDWVAHQVVWWSYNKNPAKGSWKSVNGCWAPTHWMPLPEPPR